MARNERILIVDDELGPRESLRMVLKDQYTIFTAENGAEAVEMIKDNDVDLVVMDMKMPVMDGITALKKIKEHNPLVSIIMVTGYGTVDTAVEAMKEGALDYISKPFDSMEIQQKVKSALKEAKKTVESQKMLEQIQEASESLSKQQEHLKKELVELSKLSSIGMLAQGIAHNLSSPLLIILGRAELVKEKLVKLRKKLLDDAVPPGKSEKDNVSELFHEYDQNIRDTEVIIDSVSKLTNIIRNMMDKSRHDQMKDAQLLNLSHVLKEELQFLEADLFFKHSVEKLYELEENLPLIKGIYSDFSQTFVNLIQNAIEAMYETKEKRLTVRTRYDQKAIFVEVHDTGCGIPEKNLEKIFEPYFSTKTHLKKDSAISGTGLGLHLVKILMEPYRAEATVRSTPGNTTFTLKIPCESKPPEKGK